jgi:putative ABC transport system ATP-binding protein
MIELVQITKTFNAGRPNAFSALKEISLSIAPQCVTVLKGPSGSGKTTLLSIVGCMSRPTSGRFMLNGREMTSLPERFLSETRRTMFGFVFQSYNLIKGMTVLENTMIPGYPTGLDHRTLRQRAVTLLERLRIASKAPMRVEHLSGGEQQRAAIARALVNEPSVIIADEPTAHLDTDLAEELLGFISELKKEGKTIIIASHDPLVYEADVVDRVVGIRDGRIMTGDLAA